MHASDRDIRLFAGLDRWDMGGPRRLVCVRAGQLDLAVAPARLQNPQLTEPWLLVSFAGARGWQDWSCPWLVVLQHRPTLVEVGDGGLRLQFAGAAGFIVFMPLLGQYKLAASAEPLAARPFVPPLAEGLRPWHWSKASDLPPAIVQRCRRWSRRLRAWPVGLREEFQVVPDGDLLRLRATVRYLEIRDDWGTPAEHLAPLPPTLALALATGFPATVRPAPADLTVPSAYGPYWAVAGDRYTIQFPLLKYIHEKEQALTEPQDTTARWCARRVAEIMARKFSGTDERLIWDHGGPKNFCWQVMGDRYYAKALPFADSATQANAQAVMAAYFRDWVLNPVRYRPFRGKLLLVGPGIGTWGGYDDAGKFSSNTIETVWWYAYRTADWELIRSRWDVVLKLFVTPREIRWRGFGRDAIAEMGDEAAPPLCLARLAYALGDLDTYAYACYVFVRELVHLWVKTKPQCAEWFRQRQPWHSPEPMVGRLFLTNLWGDVAGWQIDGPSYPPVTRERQHRNRWVRFGHEDVARFFRDHLARDVKAEMDWWSTRPDNPFRPGHSTAHIAPSLEQLRSLLLDESPEKLAQWTRPQALKVGRAADAISFLLSFVRTGGPRRYERLVSGLGPSPWYLGIEREAEGTDGALAVRLISRKFDWPVLATWGWAPRTGPKLRPGRRPFGLVAVGDAPPPALRSEQLNWVTRVWYAAQGP